MDELNCITPRNQLPVNLRTLINERIIILKAWTNWTTLRTNLKLQWRTKRCLSSTPYDIIPMTYPFPIEHKNEHTSPHTPWPYTIGHPTLHTWTYPQTYSLGHIPFPLSLVMMFVLMNLVDRDEASYTRVKSRGKLWKLWTSTIKVSSIFCDYNI